MVRDWTEADWASVLEIQRAVYPGYVKQPEHVKWFPACQLDAPPATRHRYVALDGSAGRPVGYAALWCVRERKYRIDLIVHPQWQRRGLGSALLDRLLADARDLGARTVQARVRADFFGALAFARRSQFVETHRMAGYRLDLNGVNPADLAAFQNRLADQDIEVETLACVREKNVNWLEHLFEVFTAARIDWPDPDPDPSPWLVPFAAFQRWLSDVRRPDAFWIAADSGRYVGFSSMFALGTAVHPAYRGRGIATGLKSHDLARARQEGLTSVEGSSANPAMRAVFEKLGYRTTTSELRMVAVSPQREP